MIFLTEHRQCKILDTPRIEAKSWEEAELICPSEQYVIGCLIEEIEVEESFFLENSLN